MSNQHSGGSMTSIAEQLRDHRPLDHDSACPTCGGETEMGFGLAGGGYGPYTYCPRCEIVTSKSPDPDDHPTPPPNDGETDAN